VDEEYFKYARLNEPRELRPLMEKYGQDVWNYAYFLTKKHDAADDIFQDVFFKAYRHMDTFRGEASMKTWLLKIARNTAYTYRKSAFLRKMVLFGQTGPNRTHPSAEDDFLREYTDDLWAVVLKLPVKYREVLVLHARYDMAEADIAALLGLPPGTVKSRLHRARAKVTALWKEEGGYERA